MYLSRFSLLTRLYFITVIRCRLDFARGYGGEHAGDYMDASSPDFVVAEFWDALAYRHGVALRNQVPITSAASTVIVAAGKLGAFRHFIHHVDLKA